MRLPELRYPKAVLIAVAAATTGMVALTAATIPPWLAILACSGLLMSLCVFTVAGDANLPTRSLEILESPFLLTQDASISPHYQRMTQSLLKLSQSREPLHREIALERVTNLADDLHGIAEGQIQFIGTEAWRVAYERLLRSRGLYMYQSVAHVRTERYWQDAPGLQSMKLNFDLQESGQLRIERVAILADNIWPEETRLPVPRISDWLQEQQSRGIQLRLVREKDLQSEPDLIGDMGIYGGRAVGIQEQNSDSRTLRFTLNFDLGAVEAAEKNWKKLAVYAVDYGELLDRSRIAD